VRHVSDRIIVMYLGKLMEVSPARELYEKPIHPYTTALLASIPIPDPKENRKRDRPLVGGEPPNPVNPPSGCRFHPRCPRATAICREVEPPLTEYAGGHLAACHHPQNVSAEEIAASRRSAASPLAAGEETPAADPAEPAAAGSGVADLEVVLPSSPRRQRGPGRPTGSLTGLVSRRIPATVNHAWPRFV